MTPTTVIGVSLNLTGLQPFTNYMVSVQASNAPIVDYGPTLSGVFATLPEAVIPPGVDPPAVVVSQASVGSSEIVKIVIPAPTFTQDHLRYTKNYTLLYMYITLSYTHVTLYFNLTPLSFLFFPNLSHSHPAIAVTCGLCASGTFSQQLETQLQTQPSQTTAHLEHTTMQRTTCRMLHLSLMRQESTSHTRLVLAMSLSQMTSPTSTGMVLSWQGGAWTALSDTLSALR